MKNRNVILFDGNAHRTLLPFTFTRPAANIRIGILTIREKWEKRLQSDISYLSPGYLSKKYPASFSSENIFINGALCPNDKLLEEIQKLNSGQSLWKENILLAAALDQTGAENFSIDNLEKDSERLLFSEQIRVIDRPWHIFQYNDEELKADFELLTKGRESQPVSTSNTVIGDDIFVEEGAVVEASILNSNTGPIYIGKDAEIMECCVIRGPFALCDHSTLKMSAKIYGATTIGPHSKVGGELNNAVIFGYSNKAHDGFLGNSVLGEWVNLGADTNNSNLKNNYANIKLWDYDQNRFIDTGLQFCGLFMGDHSKSGINTMFNTGTVVGVSANIYGSGFPRTYIPSFSWGGASRMTTFKLEKSFEVAEKMMERRNIPFTETDKDILSYIYNETEKFR